MLGRGVTVSWLNDLLVHDMTVSTLEAGPVGVIFRKEQSSSRSVMYGSFSTPGLERSRSICQIWLVFDLVMMNTALKM